MTELNSPGTIAFPNLEVEPRPVAQDVPLASSTDGGEDVDVPSKDVPSKDGFDELGSKLVQGAHEAVDLVAGKFVAAFGSVRDGVSGGSQTKDEWVDAARQAVRDHPVAAIATAILVGVALVKLAQPNAPDAPGA